jgi:hypothetical protein
MHPCFTLRRVECPGRDVLLVAATVLTLLAPLMGVACGRSASVRIGEQFTLGDISYAVKDRRSQGQFVIPPIGEAIDAGRDATFVIVELVIINNGKTTSAVTLSSFEVETPQGVRYRPDVQGTVAHAALERMHNELSVNDPRGAILRPRIPTPYTVVFRVPYRIATGNLALIIHEPALLFGARAVVTLQ